MRLQIQQPLSNPSHWWWSVKVWTLIWSARPLEIHWQKPPSVGTAKISIWIHAPSKPSASASPTWRYGRSTALTLEPLNASLTTALVNQPSKKPGSSSNVNFNIALLEERTNYQIELVLTILLLLQLASINRKQVNEINTAIRLIIVF